MGRRHPAAMLAVLVRDEVPCQEPGAAWSPGSHNTHRSLHSTRPLDWTLVCNIPAMLLQPRDMTPSLCNRIQS